VIGGFLVAVLNRDLDMIEAGVGERS